MPSALPGLYDASPQIAKLQAKLASMSQKPGPLAAHYGRQAQVLSAVSAAPKGKKFAALTATLKAQRPSRVPLGQYLKSLGKPKPSGTGLPARPPAFDGYGRLTDSSYETGVQREISQPTMGVRFT